MTYVAPFDPKELGAAAPGWEKNTVMKLDHKYGEFIKKGSVHFWISDLQSAYDCFVENRTEEKWKCQSGNNGIVMQSTLTDDDPWRGNTVEEMLQYARGEINIEPYAETRKNFQNVGGDLEQYLQKSRPGRRRSFSAEDGDLCFDRQYEVEPFATCKKMQALKIPRLTVVCDTSFNSNYDSAFIQMHTTIAWAIVDMFESVGILCSVYSTEYGSELSNKIGLSQFIFELKKHDSYVSPNSIARGLCAGFFRRLIFNCMVESALLLHDDVHSGLGRPNSPQMPLFKNGILYLHGKTTETIKDMIQTKTEPAAISRWLLKEMEPGLRDMGLQN